MTRSVEYVTEYMTCMNVCLSAIGEGMANKPLPTIPKLETIM